MKAAGYRCWNGWDRTPWNDRLLRDRLADTEVVVMFERDRPVDAAPDPSAPATAQPPGETPAPDAAPAARNGSGAAPASDPLAVSGLDALHGFAGGSVDRFVSGIDVLGRAGQDWRLSVDVNDVRGLVVRRSIPLIEANPWRGYGAAAYETAFMALGDPGFRGRFDHAHNDYIQFWVEYGAIGGAPLALFC